VIILTCGKVVVKETEDSNFFAGVVTFCRDSAVPILAEEGLTGCLPSARKRDAIGCYGDTSGFTEDEVSGLV